MSSSRLTGLRPAARSVRMERTGQGTGRRSRYAWSTVAALITGAAALSGCISVNAPDKPIVIELNINIKQEVIYRLAEDAQSTIEANPDIF